MLSRLSIRNYALIDSLDIHFDKGLNILTGETGAGKSIIMGGLSLILGQRVESRYFFNQQKKCVIEGYFDVSAYHLHEFFAEQDLDYEQETIIRREVSVDGKSRAFVNDTPVTLHVLKALTEKLIDIHSQHATLQLNTESFQLLILDSVAQNQSLREQYASVYRAYRSGSAKLAGLKDEAARARAEADYHQFLYDELAAANLESGEQLQLEAEQQQLEHAEEIKRSLLGVAGALQEEEVNVIALLNAGLQQLQQAERHMPALSSQVERLQSSLIELKDLADEVSRTEQDVSLDEERLILVTDRLSQLYALQQKHRVEDGDALIVLREELAAKLAGLSADEVAIEHLEAEVKKLWAELLELATALSQSRQSVAPLVEGEIGSVLNEVGMPHSRLHIEIVQTAEAEIKDSGRDRVDFRFTANRGQDPQPISKVASGGELSRLMLAIKSLIAKTSSLPTIIFDEIDTGISGEVALKVADIMERLATRMQVIAITHLPQIAAKGTTHFKVYKAELAEKTATHIAQLQPQDRVFELAQMLGGANPGEIAMKHAAELLGR
ncbi:MAG TPA: DNA repair protein RecN [Parapedobacter sp.]|uniref:DNA repair protein RecN n=1 Tax=Parapedobacter sp. TaxID=1958893 RepID=UPI002BF7AC7B|nr:DNA repair protein RecN [Parapedobacter sp.]HWK56478.1 DNA repair protein RecN [Parapedobacter sp.]